VKPADRLTLAGAVEDLSSAGFVEHFGVSGDALRSFDSGRTFRPGQVVIREYQRFEGISDPDDTAIIYAIEAEGGARGTLVDAYGAYSDPMVGAFLHDVPIRGGDHFAGAVTGRPSVFGAYDHGLRVPVPPDPWQDEGGESGAGQ
jgi:hypothetical protein